MPEYIERGAVLAEMISRPLPNDASLLYFAMRGIVRKAPAADVAEVVRCKDCTFGKVDAEFDSVMCFCRNAPWDNKYVDYFVMSPLDYCSYGKKKEGAENGVGNGVET